METEQINISEYTARIIKDSEEQLGNIQKDTDRPLTPVEVCTTVMSVSIFHLTDALMPVWFDALTKVLASYGDKNKTISTTETADEDDWEI